MCFLYSVNGEDYDEFGNRLPKDEDEEDSLLQTLSNRVPMPTPTSPPKFNCGDPAAVKYFEENGYVIYSKAATQEEVDRSIDLFWNHVERVIKGIKRDDPETWDDTKWP